MNWARKKHEVQICEHGCFGIAALDCTSLHCHGIRESIRENTVIGGDMILGTRLTVSIGIGNAL